MTNRAVAKLGVIVALALAFVNFCPPNAFASGPQADFETRKWSKTDC